MHFDIHKKTRFQSLIHMLYFLQLHECWCVVCARSVLRGLLSTPLQVQFTLPLAKRGPRPHQLWYTSPPLPSHIHLQTSPVITWFWFTCKSSHTTRVTCKSVQLLWSLNCLIHDYITTRHNMTSYILEPTMHYCMEKLYFLV